MRARILVSILPLVWVAAPTPARAEAPAPTDQQAAAPEPWRPWVSRGGVTYERRAVAGSKYLEYRAVTSVATPPEVARQRIWKLLTETHDASLVERRVLRQSATERVFFDHVRAPVVSDRELTLRMTLVEHGVRFETRNDLGPKPDGKRVQVPAVRGEWQIEPAGAGSRLTLVCYSEPGGTVPPFLVRGAQEEQVRTDVERVLRALGEAGRK